MYSIALRLLRVCLCTVEVVFVNELIIPIFQLCSDVEIPLLLKCTFFHQAADVLRVIQLNALEDRSVNDKQQWDAACKFLEDSVKEKLRSTEGTLRYFFFFFKLTLCYYQKCGSSVIYGFGGPSSPPLPMV